MGSPVDLTLGCNTEGHGRSNGATTLDYKNGFSAYPSGAENLESLEEQLRALKDERRKVEGFKRELPFCIELLEDAIANVKEQIRKSKNVPIQPLQLNYSSMEDEMECNVVGSPRRPVLEEFMPLKRRWEVQQRDDTERSDGERERSVEQAQQRPRSLQIEAGRPAWMAEAQLWTQNSADQPAHLQEASNKDMDDGRCLQSEQQQSCSVVITSKPRPAGALLPFLPEQPVAGPMLSRSTTSASLTDHSAGGVAELCLSAGDPYREAGDSEAASGDIHVDHRTPDGGQNGKDMQGNNNNNNIESNGNLGAAGSTSAGGTQSQRKARRCWSPELHRRFVSALHQLGGSQVATPKQIRELMKVDGLTNDEVKSHLQKYRLHTRRPSPSPQPAAPQQPQLVVLGGIWMPSQFTQPSSGLYDPNSVGNPGLQKQTPQYCHTAPLPQEYFTHISNGSPAGGTIAIHHQQQQCQQQNQQQNQQQQQQQQHHQPQQLVFAEVQQAASQSQSSPQGPLQVTSQLSGATQEEPSSEAYHEESGEDGKSDSSSRRNEGEVREQSSDGKGNNRNLETSSALQQLPRMSCRALHEQDELGHRNSGKEQAPH